MRPSLPLAATGLLAAALVSCVPDPQATTPAAFDLKPPRLIGAGARDSLTFTLQFDEEVRPVGESFSVDPGGPALATSSGNEILVQLPERQIPGRRYAIGGDLRDDGGNATRVVLSFLGFNDHPAILGLTEIQTAKNSSTTKPHRDFVEFAVLESGNLGGLEFSASSTVKTWNYAFPGVEVAKGELIVLHCAPEGLAEERDEAGNDLLASGGVDSSGARDFWSKAGGIPDASGILILRETPGGPPMDGLFYADSAKSGSVGEGLIGNLLAELVDTGKWSIAGTPAWEDAFAWKPSVSRSILRVEGNLEPGSRQWGLSPSSGQSPGR